VVKKQIPLIPAVRSTTQGMRRSCAALLRLTVKAPLRLVAHETTFPIVIATGAGVTV